MVGFLLDGRDAGVLGRCDDGIELDDVLACHNDKEERF
jgi:hypothetical protein